MNTVRDEKTVMEIAKRIKEIRIKKGLTQSEVAKKAGLDGNSYAKIERGLTKPLGVTLVKICKALGVKSSEILSV
ncbi:MAG: helix-turn-helix transcriptional regulator [Patescibacteria group bacterium]|nr:helix-turn-helix transcriptional regulator [Patescibacteria group bacterium]